MKMLTEKEELKTYIIGTNKVKARKMGYILVRLAKDGEEIITYATDGGVETKETARLDQIVVTSADYDGNPVIDKNGHVNEYLMNQETLLKKYEKIREGFYKPKGGVQTFAKLDEDVTVLVPWGKGGSLVPQYVDVGGVLNITNEEDIYGISSKDFAKSYKIVS